MLDWKKNEYKKNFLSIVLLGIVLRVLFLLFMGTEAQSDWEYGIIAENIVDGKGYSFYYFDVGKLTHEIKENSNPAPSAYMAPGYVFLLVAIKFLSNNNLENYIAFVVNILFYIAIMLYLFKITKILFNDKVALTSILIYTLIPEFIYTSYSIGTTQIYHLFLTLIIFYSLKSTISSKYTLPIIFGIAILFRFELFLLLMMIVILMLIRKNYAQVLLLILIPCIFLTPWVIRNQQTFKEFIPFSTTGGLNLYRGSNEIMIGGWHNFNTLEKLNNFKGDTSKIELFLDEMYKEEVFNYLKSDYKRASINFVKKFFYYWFINPNEEKALNMMYIAPWFILLSLSIVGFLKRKRLPTIITTILVYHTLLAIMFVPLLRYQNMMKIVLIPIAAFGFVELIRKKE
jgi:dolichyl-phosphate-mannose-protein mannosyltransferase